MTTQTAVDCRYLSYNGAARYLGVSVGTLRRWVDGGRVRAHKVGERLVRFDRAELDQLVRGSEEAASRASA